MNREPPNKLKPARFQLSGCTKGCSLNPANMPGDLGAMVHAWYEAGDNNPTIVKKLDAIGNHVSEGTVGRHRGKHLVKVHEGDRPMLSSATKGERKSDLEILDQIIGRGSDMVDLATFRITAEQLLRAIELKQKLTQGSLFQDFFGAIEEESDRLAAAEAEKENPTAVEGDEEQSERSEPQEAPLPTAPYVHGPAEDES